MLNSRGRKEQKDEGVSGKGELPHLTQPKGVRILHEKRPHSHPNQHLRARFESCADYKIISTYKMLQFSVPKSIAIMVWIMRMIITSTFYIFYEPLKLRLSKKFHFHKL